MKKITILLLALLFSINISGSQPYQIFHNFADSLNNGVEPCGSLLLSDSVFYGMTSRSGLDGKIEMEGTIYCINTNGKNFKILHNFEDAGWASTWGKENNSLVQSGNELFGMTFVGGIKWYMGSIFKINKDGSGFKTFHSFMDTSDGTNPCGSLLLSGTDLFGMAMGNDDNWSGGSIFKIKTDGSGFDTVHLFRGFADDGLRPTGSLIQSDSVLFGMTSKGGKSNRRDTSGTIFRINKDGSRFKLLHVFKGGVADGKLPYGSLIQSGNELYGMTFLGGTKDSGTVFKINMDGSGFAVIHSFTGGISDGARPEGSLIANNNYFYGTTSQGGVYSRGTVFKIGKDGSRFRLLHSFGETYSKGMSPTGDVLLYNGFLYGTTAGGGTKGYGTIFGNKAFASTDSCLLTSFEFPRFYNSSELVLNGNAKLADTNVRLSSAEINSIGSMLYFQPAIISGGFTTEFSFRFSTGHNEIGDGSPDGADGIAFLLQASSPSAIGTLGGGIGYCNIPNSLAIEFDTYKNLSDYNDPDGSHVAVFSNGKQPNSGNHNSTSLLGGTSKIPLLRADSTVYYAKIEYISDTKKLKIWMDTTGAFVAPILETDSVNLPKLLNLIEGSKAFIGFTSATGSSYQNTDLLSWSFCHYPGSFINGIEEPDNFPQQNELSIQPNPSSDFIEISVGAQGSVPDIRVFNVFSEIVLKSSEVLNNSQFSIHNSQLRIDVSGLPAGVYFVRIGDKVSKFIKI